MIANQHVRTCLVGDRGAKAAVSFVRQIPGRSIIPLMLVLGLLLASRPANASAAAQQTLAGAEPNLHALALSISQVNNLESMSDVSRHVEIDISPGNTKNLVRIGSDSLVAVALLSSPPLFAPAEVSPSTIRLASAPVRSKRKPDLPLGSAASTQSGLADPFPCEAMDVNGDRLDDLICYVQTSQMDLPLGLTVANLVARTHDGDLLTGQDEVEVVELNIHSEIYLPVILVD